MLTLSGGRGWILVTLHIHMAITNNRTVCVHVLQTPILLWYCFLQSIKTAYHIYFQCRTINDTLPQSDQYPTNTWRRMQIGYCITVFFAVGNAYWEESYLKWWSWVSHEFRSHPRTQRRCQHIHRLSVIFVIGMHALLSINHSSFLQTLGHKIDNWLSEKRRHLIIGLFQLPSILIWKIWSSMRNYLTFHG